MRGASLRRVSTRPQAEEGYSLDNQAAMIAAYAAAHGITIVEDVLVGGGVSGHADHRADLERVRELVEARAIDCVVACNIERTARRAWVSLELLEYLRKRKIDFLFVQHPSPNTPAGRLLVTVLAGVAEFDWETIRDKSSAGRHAKARSGLWPAGRAPYGYRCVSRAEAEVKGEHPSGTLLLHEEEAAVVRAMFEQYAAGLSLYLLCCWLRDAGHRTSGGEQWRIEHVRRTLINPAYVGRAHYGETVVPCPPIVSDALFAAAAERLRLNAIVLTGRPSQRYPLSGCLYCGTCRRRDGLPRRLTGSCGSWQDRRYRRYICPSTSRTELPSCGLRMRAEPVEEQVARLIRRVLESDLLLDYARAEERRLLEQQAGPASELREVEKRLAALDREEDRALSESLAGAPAGAVQRRYADLRARRATLEARRVELLHQQPAAPLRLVSSAEELRTRLASAWDGDLLPLRPLLRAVLVVTVARDRRLTFGWRLGTAG